MIKIPPNYWNGINSLEYECPWLTPESVLYLDRILKPHFRILEYGCGGSTLFFSRRCASVLSFETDQTWYNNTNVELTKRGISNCKLILTLIESDITELLKAEKPFDVVLIDCYQSVSRQKRMEMSLPYITKESIVILDNYDAGPDSGALCGRFIDSLLPGWKNMTFDDEHWVGKGTKIFYN